MTTYPYSQLKGIIKVGDIVSAVPGKKNRCDRLLDNGRNTQKITRVNDIWFYIDECFHSYNETGYLRIHTVSPKTVRDAQVGEVVVEKDDEFGRVVLERLENTVFLSEDGYFHRTSHWITLDGLIKYYTLKGAEPEPKELTLKDISKKFGIPVDKIRIKDYGK